MKKRVILRRFFHRDRWRIGIIFDFDPVTDGLVRSIPGRSFSTTNKCWYVDDSEESIKVILRTFRDEAEVDISGISSPGSISDARQTESIDIQGTESQIISFADLDFEGGVSQSSEQGKGTVSEQGTRKPKKGFGSVELRVSEETGRIVIRFTGRYDRVWIDELKSYGRLYYDRSRKEFLLPYSGLTVDSLSDYFSSNGVDLKVNKSLLPEGIKEERADTGREVRLRELSAGSVEGIKILRDYLEENRYSPRTVEVYITQLELFFKYFSNRDPEEITHNELSGFVNDFIIRLGFSASFQNQVISAIKTYYEITGRGRIIPQVLERPRRSRALPKVFSKEEVGRILNSSRNDKHKLLLWMIYSCGLRRSEVTKIKLDDLDRDRGILHIREGKGMVDRIVPVSAKVWDKIDSYLKSYSPKRYLFEGQGGGIYSSESVYNVFRQALRKSGIKRDVGVHSLRHSYATHLHESGLDIRYIQELLGHKSTRTTEIYTHVSRRNLIALRSPIEDLDVS